MLIDQVVIVTGGTRGIGKGIVELLLKDGAKTIVLAKNKQSISKLEQAFVSTDQLDVYQCDISSSKEVSEVISMIYEKYQQLDILINNAGVGVFKQMEELTEDDWDVQINTNLKGAFLCSQAAYRIMKETSGGQIINIASDLAYNTKETASAYCASKWGLLGFSKTMNLEGRKYGIRVATVSPGLVQTDFAGVTASKKTHGLTVESVARQVLQAITTDKDVGEVEKIIRP